MARSGGTATGHFTVTMDDSGVLDYLSRVSAATQNASKRGVRAALAVIRAEAARRAPAQRWQNPDKSFKTSVDADRVADHVVKSEAGFKTVCRLVSVVARGSLTSRAPGNIIEVGARAHNAPMDGHLMRYLRKHGLAHLIQARGLVVRRGGKKVFVTFKASPRLLRWARAHTRPGPDGKPVPLSRRTYLPVKAKAARPFVIPAALAAQAEASAAFAVEIYDAMRKA